jgi:hypothetical protein
MSTTGGPYRLTSMIDWSGGPGMRSRRRTSFGASSRATNSAIDGRLHAEDAMVGDSRD